MTEDGKKKVQEIKYPRHILVVGSPEADSLGLLKELTGSAPTPREIPIPKDPLALPKENDDDVPEQSEMSTKATAAGLSHKLELSTCYYRASIPIWIDETDKPHEWKDDFRSSEASEVVKAVGAWIVVFQKTVEGWKWAQQMMNAIRDSVNLAYGEDVWDGALLCVGLPAERDTIQPAENAMSTGYEDWEDDCFDLGFELVDGEVTGDAAKTRNAAGELQGTARLMEALEATEWDNVDDLTESMLGMEDDDAEETLGFRMERAQMEQEFAGLKMAMADDQAQGEAVEGDEEQQVEELERMMSKMHAVRDMSAHMPEQERKRLAKKAVNDIMKGMS